MKSNSVPLTPVKHYCAELKLDNTCNLQRNKELPSNRGALLLLCRVTNWPGEKCCVPLILNTWHALHAIEVNHFINNNPLKLLVKVWDSFFPDIWRP